AAREDLGCDDLGVPGARGLVGQVHEVGVESALVERVRLASGIGDEVSRLLRLGEEVPLRCDLLLPGVHEERVDVGGDGDAVAVEIGNEVFPPWVSLFVELPGPPQPLAERCGALPRPVLKPHSCDLGVCFLKRPDGFPYLLGAALDADDRSFARPMCEFWALGSRVLLSNELQRGVRGNEFRSYPPRV